MKIVFLGTGGGFPSKERGVSAVAVRVNGDIALFDCGEGTQRQLMFSSLSYMKIRRIFISHFHGDHFLGTAGLVQSMCLNNRDDPLEIYGPVGTIDFMRAFMKIGYFNQTMPVLYHDLEGGEVLEFEKYSVRCMAADHEVPALAFALEEPERPGRFNPRKAKSLGVIEGPDFRKLQSGKTVTVGGGKEKGVKCKGEKEKGVKCKGEKEKIEKGKEKGRKVTPDMVMGKPRRGRKFVYTGDTRPNEGLADLALSADVLVHDSTFHSEFTERGLEFGHSTSKHAAELAKEAKVKKLFLTHISNRYSTDPSPLLEEAQAIFPNTEMASDLMEYDVPRKR